MFKTLLIIVFTSNLSLAMINNDDLKNDNSSQHTLKNNLYDKSKKIRTQQPRTYKQNEDAIGVSEDPHFNESLFTKFMRFILRQQD